MHNLSICFNDGPGEQAQVGMYTGMRKYIEEGG